MKATIHVKVIANFLMIYLEACRSVMSNSSKVGSQDTLAECSVNAVLNCPIRRAAFLIYFLVVTLQLTILAVLSKNFFLGLLDAYFVELEQYFIVKCFNQRSFSLDWY